MTAESPINVLLVEDNPADVLLTKEVLSSDRFRTQSVARLSDAISILTAEHFDIVLLDLGLPDAQGLDTLRRLRGKHQQTAIVVLTGKDDEQLALKSLQEGAQDYLVKGHIQSESLHRAIRYAVERVSAKKMLRQSEERLQELTAHIDLVLWIIDAQESKVLYVSPAYEQMSGRARPSLNQHPNFLLEGVHPDDRQMMAGAIEHMFKTGYIDVESRIQPPDGLVRRVWIRGYPVTEKGKITRLVGVTEDITQRWQLAQERDALLSHLQLYIDRLPLAYMVFDATLRVVEWNPCAASLFGYAKSEIVFDEEPLKSLIPALCSEETESLLARIQRGDIPAQSTYDCISKDGHKIACEWFNTPLFGDDGTFNGLLCLAQDLTEKKTLESQFQQAQKMEVVGHLAGGVAHDFNNLLAVVLCSCQFLEDDSSLGQESRELVRDIENAANRAAAMTRQLLAFSRQQILQPRRLNLNDIASETVKMLNRLIGEDITLRMQLDQRLWLVKVDAGQMNQVIMNLAVNARDAMSRGGTLIIETKNIELDETYTQSRPFIKAGDYVALSVSDTGCGMDEQTQCHIFEPFFTTKEAGKGTGLGLATVFGIVKQSEGHIHVYSEVGKGTTFTIYLPKDESAASPSTESRFDRGRARGTETILVVEDEDMMRKLACRILKSQGYAVLEARNGEEAIQTFEREVRAVALIVTDVVMPEMGGRQLYDYLRTKQADLKVLFMSGYTDDAVIRGGVLDAEANFIQKPFTYDGLALAVRQALDEKK